MPVVSPRVLAVHRFLFRFALAAGNIFGWIIVFRVLLFFSANISAALVGTAGLYALSQMLCFLLTPLTGAALRFGTRRALVIGSLVSALSFAFLAQLFISKLALFADGAFWLIAGFAVLSGMGRAIYFVPYATAAAHMNDRRAHAVLREAVLALAPFLAALFVIAVGAGVLFAIIAALMLTAAIALVEMPTTYERFDWSYSETLRALASRPHRPALWLAFFDGAQGTAFLLIWPLLVYLLFGGSLIVLGTLITTTLLLALALRALLRHRIRSRFMGSPYVLAAVAFSSWIFRLPAGTPVQVIVADLFYQSAADPRGRGIDLYAASQNADNAHYVDEYTALKEMGQCLGGILMCLLFAALAIVFTPIVAFAIGIVAAALAAAASVLLSHRLAKSAY